MQDVGVMDSLSSWNHSSDSLRQSLDAAIHKTDLSDIPHKNIYDTKSDVWGQSYHTFISS